jgi:hypothetical protein
MQYALFRVKDRDFIVDANEVSAFDTFGDDIADTDTKPDEDGPFYVAYGVYKPQPGITPEQGRSHLLEHQDAWLGHVDAELCHSVGLHAIEIFPATESMSMFNLPFAALIQADEFLVERIADHKRVQAVTTFARYWSISPARNIFRRNGILAMKGIEKRVKVKIEKENWRELIDPKRAVNNANKIR